MLLQLVAEDNDALLRKYREHFAAPTSIRILAAIWEALKRYKLRPKGSYGWPTAYRPEFAAESKACRR